MSTWMSCMHFDSYSIVQSASLQKSTAVLPNIIPRPSLLSLVGDLDLLPAELEVRKRLLGRNRASLVLVLGEGDGVSAGHQAYLAEAWVASEDDSKHVLAVVLGQIAQEERLVGREIFVGQRAASGSRWLRTLSWTLCEVVFRCALGWCGGGFLCLLAFCGWY